MKPLLFTICLAALCGGGWGSAQAQSYEVTMSSFNAGGNAADSDAYAFMGSFIGVDAGDFRSAQYVLRPEMMEMPTAVSWPNGLRLRIARVERGIRVSWPLSGRGCVLESSSTLESLGAWIDREESYSYNETECFVIIPIEKTARYYRLRLP